MGPDRLAYPPLLLSGGNEREPAKSGSKPKFLQNTRDKSGKSAKPRQMTDWQRAEILAALDKVYGPYESIELKRALLNQALELARLKKAVLEVPDHA